MAGGHSRDKIKERGKKSTMKNQPGDGCCTHAIGIERRKSGALRPNSTTRRTKTLYPEFDFLLQFKQWITARIMDVTVLPPLFDYWNIKINFGLLLL
jgi:hypothetical protein